MGACAGRRGRRRDVHVAQEDLQGKGRRAGRLRGVRGTGGRQAGPMGSPIRLELHATQLPMQAGMPSVQPPPASLTESDSVSQALFDLEATNTELKTDLRDLYITAAAEVDVSASRKAIIIHVSPRQPHRGSATCPMLAFEHGWWHVGEGWRRACLCAPQPRWTPTKQRA